MKSAIDRFADRLAPGLREYLEFCDAFYGPDSGEATIAEQRATFSRLCVALAGKRPEGIEVRDLSCAGPAGPIRLRLYRPAGAAILPGLVYFHGGGWVVGDLETHDDHVSWIAARAGVAAVAVDYRLAPEHVFPAALDDCFAALRHVVASAGKLGIDADRIGVAGDSAGGALAAGVALRARDSGGPALARQILIYPALGTDFTLPSCRENAEAPALTTADMKWYWRTYLGGDPADADGYAAPLRAVDLSGLPPALVLGCELDPLRDDATVYADRLQEAKVDTARHMGRGLTHGILRARRRSAEAGRFFDAICAGVAKLHEG